MVGPVYDSCLPPGQEKGLVTRKTVKAGDGLAVHLAPGGGAAGDIRRGQTLHIKLELSDLAEAVLLPIDGFWESTGGSSC